MFVSVRVAHLPLLCLGDLPRHRAILSSWFALVRRVWLILWYLSPQDVAHANLSAGSDAAQSAPSFCSKIIKFRSACHRVTCEAHTKANVDEIGLGTVLKPLPEFASMGNNRIARISGSFKVYEM